MAEAGPATQAAVRAVAVGACSEPLPAHDRTVDRAINVVGWVIDDGGRLHAVAVSADGSVGFVAREAVLFDHAVRPTDY